MKKIILLAGFVALIATACNSSKNAKASTGATASLTNTYWKLSEMNGKKVETPDNQKEVHIKFSTKENNFQGFGGCNGLGGSYELTGKDGIKIRALSTQMFCDRMEVENFLKNAVTKADRYEIKGEKLSLYQGKTLLISFDSIYF